METSINVDAQTIPTLPSRSIAQTVAFYRRLGFVGDAHPHDAGYAILRLGDVELHFFAHPDLDPVRLLCGLLHPGGRCGCHPRSDEGRRAA